MPQKNGHGEFSKQVWPKFSGDVMLAMPAAAYAALPLALQGGHQ
jgi:hypothetical protein